MPSSQRRLAAGFPCMETSIPVRIIARTNSACGTCNTMSYSNTYNSPAEICRLIISYQLLRTPRHLKRVLQRIDATWQHLHGEADLDDILIVTALRESATSVYEFLLGHIDAARHELDEALLNTTTVKSDWDRLLESLPNRQAIQGLVDQLGIEQLSTSPALGDIDAPQGVHLSGPNDYFRRIISEQLSPDELRDQTVLRDIDAWRQTRAGLLVDRLASASESDRYASMWAHFAARHADDELHELARDVATSLLQRDGCEATADHPALFALLRRCRDQLHRDQNMEWGSGANFGGRPGKFKFRGQIL